MNVSCNQIYLALMCRLNQIIFRAENVLDPAVLEQMLAVSMRVRAIRTPSNLTWDDVCFRLGSFIYQRLEEFK
jgi:hypothetical protein